MGQAGEGMNISHQQKKLDYDAIRRFRDRFGLPVPDDQIKALPYLKFAEGSPELTYMRQRRMDLGGYLPKRRRLAEPLEIPELSAFETLLKASGEGREVSTTMAIVRFLNILLKDKKVGRHVVPIVPDESRTFGMEGLFRQIGIWNQEGQKYVPEDHDQLMFYKESKDGQVLQEGINEAGAMSDWIAAATCVLGTWRADDSLLHLLLDVRFSAHHGSVLGGWRPACPRFPDRRHRRPHDLNGEGLQHEDGHSLILSGLIPNCLSYDPTFSFEVAVIMREGMRRMYQEQEDIFYYLTVMNENYEHPEMPAGAEADILKGMYLLRRGQSSDSNPAAPRVQLLGSGTIFREVIAAADLLKNDWGVDADLWAARASPNWRATATTCSAANLLNPPPGHRCRMSRPAWAIPAARSSPRPTTCACSPSRFALPQPSLRHARHRRLRPLGHAREAASLLRGRSSLGHRCRAQSPGRRWHDRAQQGRRSDRPVRHRREQTQPDDGLREAL
jgi:pyruvate dehydrogenase E1 component